MTFVIDSQMDRLSNAMLQELMSERPGPCLSIYMPTEIMGAQTQQNRIRLKNLLAEAETALMPLVARKVEIEPLLAPITALMANEAFWQQQSEGLALFLAPDFFQSYRLPVQFPELVVAEDRFHIKPLLPMLSIDGTFYLLALRQGGVSLLQGTRFGLAEIALSDDVPTSLQEALKYDDFESSLQFHTGTGTNPQGGGRSAIFHGHGGGDDAENREQILRFFRQLDNGVRDLLEGSNHPPLVLAGVSFLQGLYTQVNQYSDLVAEGIQHDPEAMDQLELHQAAWALVEPTFSEGREQALADLHSLIGNDDERAAKNLEQIISGAYFQRIDTLFIPEDMPLWGTFDPEKNRIQLVNERKPGTTDLLDFAAIHTMLNGGAVYFVPQMELPREAPAAAIFRY